MIIRMHICPSSFFLLLVMHHWLFLFCHTCVMHVFFLVIYVWWDFSSFWCSFFHLVSWIFPVLLIILGFFLSCSSSWDFPPRDRPIHSCYIVVRKREKNKSKGDADLTIRWFLSFDINFFGFFEKTTKRFFLALNPNMVMVFFQYLFF